MHKCMLFAAYDTTEQTSLCHIKIGDLPAACVHNGSEADSDGQVRDMRYGLNGNILFPDLQESQ